MAGSSSLQSVDVDLLISADEYLKYYRGESQVVSCRARDGRRLRFPVGILQPFLKHNGICGSFRIRFDAQGKFVDILPL
ncbi:DUF2835 domain-containing protein [Motiliproteus coralliicola]|uniref:DUF2835 domain-containing protein n=1 Tax=Motiliproteus coralliicola TaxID=2283196 RepID=UPI001FB4C605|nr:DUF2835 domain-containing protein [Motiliproteus coralliicola]